ncbi:MAG: barstar family protein [Xanthomonadaceae bacterium]|jgi:RNAse (barnase) inhibitor barstar|nr:barstar family protein [Xanthomonadaceae bacterium]
MSEPGLQLDLSDASEAGVYLIADTDLNAISAAARSAALRLCRIDLFGCDSKATLLLRLSTSLDFPAGRGRNWDAIADGLRDLGWMPAPGYALVFEDIDTLRNAQPEDFGTLVDILQEAAQFWAEDETPFWVFMSTANNAGADEGQD